MLGDFVQFELITIILLDTMNVDVILAEALECVAQFVDLICVIFCCNFLTGPSNYIDRLSCQLLLFDVVTVAKILRFLSPVVALYVVTIQVRSLVCK